MNKWRRKFPDGSGMVLILLLILPLTTAIVEMRCGTIDIRNRPSGFLNNRNYKDPDAITGSSVLNCTVVEGSFILALINNSKGSFTRQQFPEFKYLREITGSVLIFEVVGLKSLSWVLPNLRVIGGQNLIQHYSLVVYKNNDLEDLGLKHLSVIRNGGVRIADNKRLCHTKTINWKNMIMSRVNDVVLDDAAETSITETGKICPKGDCEHDPDQQKCRYIEHKERMQSCWNSTTCQRYCAYDRINEKIGPGCDPYGNKCDDECLGGCDKPNDPRSCHACRNFHYQGRCIAKCADNLFSYLNRRCVTRAKCLSLRPHGNDTEPMKAVNGICSSKCPENYSENALNKHECVKCEKECEITCPGNQTIDNYSKALKLKRCHIIDGSLTIEIRNTMDAGMASVIGEGFGKIHTIKGYLAINRSPSFVNLFMFKSLRKIEGRFFNNVKYSLTIIDNANLKKLFDPNLDLKIERGYVEVHNNRNLCFKQIRELMERVGKAKEMSEVDQSLSSNGDKAICEELSFEVTVTNVNANAIFLTWPAFNTSDIDHRKFLGYEVYYKEVAEVDHNMTIDEDRSACSDTWHSTFIERREQDDVKDTHVSALISNQYIRPFTTYAYYVSTQMVVHPGARNAISKIGFVTTNFSTPDPPTVTVAKVSSDTIELVWEPPLKPNGIITHYLIQWREFDVDVKDLATRFCSVDLQSHQKMELELIDEDDKEASTTMAPRLFDPQGSGGGTCSAIAGCCECKRTMTVEQTEEDSAFENDLQDVVFVQRKVRRRRSIGEAPHDKDEVPVDVEEKSIEKTEERKEQQAKLIPDRLREFEVAAKSNGTNAFTIINLKHYTQYSITVSACQDRNTPGHSCSPPSKAAKLKRTKPLTDVDQVANETIRIDYMNTTSSVRISWMAPNNSNGGIQGYYVKMINIAGAAPHQICQPAIDGNWTAEKDGVVFKNLADGEYRVEIIAISLLKTFSEGTQCSKIVRIYTPGFWNWQRIIAALIILIVFIGCAVGVGYYFMNKYYGKKLITHLMSSNPEFIIDQVYKADDWELARDSLDMLEEIGSGTFGKVFRGMGKDVQSKCGESFGECAIKMVQDDKNATQRLHFLLEANVMKGFNAPFIVKLYGVVSTSQPTLCVMELMELGNLRDYLRSRRPGGEKNVENLPVPSADQYHEWAAQIADGMAYLESIKFCHRDLAARNCMVHADETVKIGDFGMARDLYYHDYYKPTGKRLMPVRWMAPESLKDGKFDSKSDCWSYGIVLYEMVTLGQQPYQGLSNDEVLTYIGMTKKILEKPRECPEYWYKIMQMCWRYDPRDRPSFAQIVHVLASDASERFREVSYVCNNNMTIESADDEETERLRNDSIQMKEMKSMRSSRSSTSSHSFLMSSRKSSMKSHSGYQPIANGDAATPYGDYVVQDSREHATLPHSISATPKIENDDSYCISNRNGAMEFPGWSEGDRLTGSCSSSTMNGASE